MTAQTSRTLARAPIRAIFKTYFRIARRYPTSGILVFVCYAGGSILSDIVLGLYIREIFDVIAVSAPSTETWSALLRILLHIIGVVLMYNVFWRSADFCMTYFQANCLRDLMDLSMTKLSKRSDSFFTGQFTGGLVAKVRRFVTGFETLHDKTVYDFWRTGVILAGIFVVIVAQMPLLALFFGLWIVGYLMISVLFLRYRLRFDYILAEADSTVTASLSDIITNVLNLKIFTSEHPELEKFSGVTQHEYTARKNSWDKTNIFHALQSISMGILEIGGMYIALQAWQAGRISAGTIVLVQYYFTSVIFQTWNIGRAMSDSFKALSNAEEFVRILEAPLEVTDPFKPEVCSIQKGSIHLQSIGFKYREGKHVFDDFSLTIPAGQRVGIVGFSGAGKSTLFKLLLRFLDVTNGSITIDGQDLRSITQDDLRKNISYVPQEPILFHRSLFENIAYGRAGATEAEVIDSAKRAHAHDFIVGLQKGYDTLVGERGIKLSGGERQRVALARVILKNAPILLLDEATSSLDSVSEKYIQQQLTEIMKDRTTLAIAHRISTIKQMDRIIVLADGKIVEDGSHAELLEKNGTYANLWTHQSQGFIVEEEKEG